MQWKKGPKFCDLPKVVYSYGTKISSDMCTNNKAAKIYIVLLSVDEICKFRHRFPTIKTSGKKVILPLLESKAKKILYFFC